MPFIKRDKHGEISAVSQTQDAVFSEQVSSDDADFRCYILNLTKENSTLTESDLDFVRVVEDLIELLVSKNYILFTELPEKAQEKMRLRRNLRGELGSRLDLLSDDDDGFF